MNKIVSKKAALLKFTFLLLFTQVSIVMAHYDTAYWNERSSSGVRAGWMNWIPDSLRVSDLSLPGTHDTMTGGVKLVGHDIARTQSMTLYQQLESGIRVLDIRVKHNGNSFPIYHGIVDLGVDFEEVLQTIQTFLRQNPTETVFMRLKQENSNASDSKMLALFDTYYNRYKDMFWKKNNTENPTMGDIRGKLVLLSDVLSLNKYGISYRNIDKQDSYKLGSNWNLYSKWEKIKKQFQTSNRNKSSSKIYMNYLSGSVGVFPYFVASGHSSPGTSAPRLATGLTEPGWKGVYPDFPRGAWFGIIATIYFEGTNTLTANYLEKNKISLAGMVMADFPGRRLIDSIIQCNKYKIQQKGLRQRL